MNVAVMNRAAPLQILSAVILIISLLVSAASAQQGIRKQVFLVVDGDRLVASNVRTNGFAELRLDARERMLDSAEGEGVIVVVTNQRLLAYGAFSGWSARDRETNEQIQTLSAVDYAGLIVTTRRMLNFNGETGVWGERQRRVGQ
jgi:hypothetical protein